MEPTFNTDDVLWSNKYGQKELAAEHISDFAKHLAAKRQNPFVDIGRPNAKKYLIQNSLKSRIESLYGWDFDYDFPTVQNRKFGTVFCLEILEHLYNPLFFLENLKEILDRNGSIVLSTPGRPHFLWTEHHFHEIDDKRIKWLFNRAGLEVVRERKYRLWRGLKFHLSGIRPFLRMFTYGRVYELKRKEK